MFFSIYDRQTDKMMFTGRNSNTKEDAVNTGFLYLTKGWGRREITSAALDKERTLDRHEFSVVLHFNPLSDPEILYENDATIIDDHTVAILDKNGVSKCLRIKKDAG